MQHAQGRRVDATHPTHEVGGLVEPFIRHVEPRLSAHGIYWREGDLLLDLGLSHHRDSRRRIKCRLRAP